MIPILPKADVEHFVNPRASIVGSGSVSARDTVLLPHNCFGGSEVDEYEIQRVCLGELWVGGGGSEHNSINKHTANITALVTHSSSNMALTNIKLCDKGTSVEF